jgi:hypothetical protein
VTGSAAQSRGREPRAGAVVACACIVLFALPAFAQQVQVKVERGPHYVADGIDVTVLADGFEEEPQPEIRAPSVQHGRLTYHGISPQSSTSITIINGQMTRERRVTFTYHYRFVADRPGRVEIPGFEIVQGAVSRRTAPVALQLREVPTSDALAVRMKLPKGPLFVGQRVRVGVEFEIARELQNDLVSYALRVPLFESPRYRFSDDPRGSGDTELQVQTEDGTLLLPARSREILRGGKKVLVVEAERTMIPLEVGEVELPGATVIANRGTRFRRDMFRTRQATAVQKLMARSSPVSLEIAELPSDDRPASFAGAIGRGFSLELTADRSVVQVGEPIQLSFRVRGDGDLTSAALPPLDAEGLLDPALFRVPDEPPPGRLVDADGRVKEFEATVRVLDAAVREIPALEYSWFDADTRRFETTRSRPIALSVGAAEVIGAGAVERREGAEAELLAEPQAPRGGPARSGSLALTGADLAIERAPHELLRDDRATGSGAIALGGLYVLGIAFVGLAAVDRRRRDIDPLVVERRRTLAAARSDVEAALVLPERDAAEALGRALRNMLATVPDAGGRELDALLGECDARSYAPAAAGGGTLPAELAERARELARAIEEAGQ